MAIDYEELGKRRAKGLAKSVGTTLYSAKFGKSLWPGAEKAWKAEYEAVWEKDSEMVSKTESQVLEDMLKTVDTTMSTSEKEEAIDVATEKVINKMVLLKRLKKEVARSGLP